MYIKCLVILTILFVCASCKLLTDRIPIEITYTTTDRLNMVLSLSKIPKNVEYSLKRYTPNNISNVELIEHGNIKGSDETYHRISLNTTIIEKDHNYFIELLSADGSPCDFRDVFRLIANDLNGREMKKHDCLDQQRACHIQIDFDFKCSNSNAVIVTLDNPSLHKRLKSDVSKNEKIYYFNEYEQLNFTCQQNRTSDNYNLTWKQHFPTAKVFFVSEKLPRNTSYLLQITLQWFDNGTAVSCAGAGDQNSTLFIFKLNGTQTEMKKIETKEFNENKPATIECGKDKKLIKRKANGNFMFYNTKPAEIQDKGENGSTLFCMKYVKKGLKKKGQKIFQVSRKIYNEIMYIYNANLKGGSNVAIWVTGVIVAAIIVAGSIVLLRYKRCQFRNRPINPQEHIYETPMEVVYAEINALPCSSEKPNPTRDEPPYAKIIGVLGPKNPRTDGAPVSANK